MSSTNNSSNRMVVPEAKEAMDKFKMEYEHAQFNQELFDKIVDEFMDEAKEAMDKFKMEVASELGVPLTNGYNGNLTSYQNGSVGGYMVKKMIEEQEKKMAGK